jgi:hypothetical protein
VQGDAGHPSLQGGGQENNNLIKMEGRGEGEAPGVADKYALSDQSFSLSEFHKV